jgi:hypothetical protein
MKNSKQFKQGILNYYNKIFGTNYPTFEHISDINYAIYYFALMNRIDIPIFDDFDFSELLVQQGDYDLITRHSWLRSDPKISDKVFNFMLLASLVDNDESIQKSVKEYMNNVANPGNRNKHQPIIVKFP